MTKYFQKFGLIFLILIFAIIIIPIVINEAYKHEVIYVTMWSASDVLSYYGTILGAIATATAMVVTIFLHENIFTEIVILKMKKKSGKKLKLF